MRKGTDLIGKPVVSFDTGEQFERIHDLLFDQHNNQLLGFVVDDGGWFSSARILPLGSVQAIGPDTVIVPNKRVIVSSDSDQRYQSILARNNILKGTKVVTTDGRDLGTLSDLYFDEQTGTVEGYEASGGLFADSYTGRSFIPAPNALKIGEDVAFVPPETADLMAEQVGGFKGAIQDANDTVAEQIGQRGVEQAIGRRVNQPVRTGEGLIIAAAGQIVTEQIINRARTYHAEGDLLQATGMSSAGDDGGRQSTAGARPGTTREGASTGLQQGAAEVKHGAASLWEKVKEKVTGVQEQASERLEEQQIQAAVGRPTDRVILDPQDNVILNAGELITNQAVRMAREAGVLNILLSSVADVHPDISAAQLKVDHPGEAALDGQEWPQHEPTARK